MSFYNIFCVFGLYIFLQGTRRVAALQCCSLYNIKPLKTKRAKVAANEMPVMERNHIHVTTVLWYYSPSFNCKCKELS